MVICYTYIGVKSNGMDRVRKSLFLGDKVVRITVGLKTLLIVPWLEILSDELEEFLKLRETICLCVKFLFVFTVGIIFRRVSILKMRPLGYHRRNVVLNSKF